MFTNFWIWIASIVNYTRDVKNLRREGSKGIFAYARRYFPDTAMSVSSRYENWAKMCLVTDAKEWRSTMKGEKTDEYEGPRAIVEAPTCQPLTKEESHNEANQSARATSITVTGAVVGAIVGGPVGALVGTAVGAAAAAAAAIAGLTK